MPECLRIMKEKGQIFSVLYPFSFAYYRKFGYEAAYERRWAEIPINFFCKYPYPKTPVRFWEKGHSLSDIGSVYDTFKAHRNYALDREGDAMRWGQEGVRRGWNELLKDDPYITKRYTYTHYNSQGRPDSYIVFDAREPGHTDMKIVELAWAAKDGLFDMFGFIGGLRPQFDTVHWEVPDDLDLSSLFPEANEIKYAIEPSAMTRIVDLPEVLKRLRPPSISNGNVVIEVADKSFPCNTGKYGITWSNGKIAVSTTGQAPDMTTTIEAMAQMVTGYLSPEKAAYRPDTTIYSRHEALAALFYKKNLYLWERF